MLIADVALITSNQQFSSSLNQMTKSEGFMDKVISWVKNLRPRQIMTVFLVGLTVFVIQSFSDGKALQARADVQSPAGIYYKGTPDETDSINRDQTGNINKDNQLVEKARKNLKETTNNAWERLNSNEALKTAESTYYKATPESNSTQSNNVIEQARQNLQETAQNIKEKLNLDEPLPESTKEFLRVN